VSQSDAPRVSVVMAVRDGERYLRTAIDSVLTQTFRNLELIVIDDGSTDHSAAIVRGVEDPRIRLLSNDGKRGLASSLNRGVTEARGEFIARLDADDIAMPERLARQLAFMDANPHVALLGSWYVEISEDGEPLVRRRLPTEHWDLRWHLCVTCPFIHSAVLWRRSMVAERVGGYDETISYGEDYDLWHRLAARLPVATLPAYLVQHRLHSGSMTSTHAARARAGVRMRIQSAARLLGWPTDDDANEARLRRLYELLVSTPRQPPGRQWLHDARELLRLHGAFAATEGVPPRVAARQRRAIVAGLVRRGWQGLIGAASRRLKER